MRSGKYRHVITVRGLIDGGTDPLSGLPIREWGDVYPNIRAEVLTGPGREGVAAGAERAETDARIHIRKGDLIIDPQMRVVWENAPTGDRPEYAIQSIEYDATAQREIRLRCVHGREDG